jgi:hypothetical protein
MRRKKPIALISGAAIGLMLLASHVSAAPSPRTDCVTVSRQEYESAKRRHALRTRFGTYLKTGRLVRRQYLYCQT